VFVADENIDSAIVRRLRGDGHDVVWIAWQLRRTVTPIRATLPHGERDLTTVVQPPRET
jgi:hypothetical protein